MIKIVVISFHPLHYMHYTGCYDEPKVGKFSYENELSRVIKCFKIGLGKHRRREQLIIPSVVIPVVVVACLPAM